ncbi:MAG: Fe(3+) ABC transporter substrate-binding protein [Bacteroidota bacterium]|nr:Fe(3+) ABC transporter substrate-binding protein [Bacteroidota bacterium]
MPRSVLLFFLAFVACSEKANNDPEQNQPEVRSPREVNLYSHRHYETDGQLFTLFTQHTGIKVNIVQAGDDELMARLEAEGSKSPCDLFITADAGRLGSATSRGLLQPVNSQVLDSNIPSRYRDPQGHWYGLTMRARVIAYNKQKVDPTAIDDYFDLTRTEWRGRILVRSSENVYNQSLMGALIENTGQDSAGLWAKGIVRNMARQPIGGDTDQLLAVAEGIGDVAIANSYYIGKLMAGNEPEKQRAREVLGVIFPRIPGGGTHVNISGGGVARYAPHKKEAIELLEFLSGDEAQAIFAEGNQEYPVKMGTPIPKELAAFGEFTPDTLNLAVLGSNNADAVKILEAAGWR